MNDSIFTKIIKGEIPCHKIYEDEKTFAFLDIHPITSGHTLVVPKRQIEFVWDLSSVDYRALMRACQLVAKQIQKVLDVPYVGSQIIGVDVPHAHVHLIPFTTVDQFHNLPNTSTEPDHQVLTSIASRLAF
ncbi:MAG: HIT family protein [Candidatus Saccharimonadales bacterium]